MCSVPRDRPVRWGILGAARIADEAVIPALRASPVAEISAVASRDGDRAAAMAARHGIATSHGSYDALIADPAVDAVYVALPNHLHVEWARKAAANGRHVLVEKPIALRAAELTALDGLDPTIRIAEAFMVRHQPRWQALRNRLAAGTDGDVRTVSSLLSFTMATPDDYRARPEFGGGATYDLGCYAVMAARFVFAGEPLRVLAECHRDDRGVDLFTSAILDFGQGRHATSAVSFAQASAQVLHVVCERATIDLPKPFITSPAEPTMFHVDVTHDLRVSNVSTLSFDPVDQYEAEVTNFSRAVRGQAAPFYGLDDARANMEVLDAIFASARAGTWVTIERAATRGV